MKLSKQAIPEEQAKRLVDFILNLDQQASVGELPDLLAAR
jgi:hypothetical protein